MCTRHCGLRYAWPRSECAGRVADLDVLLQDLLLTFCDADAIVNKDGVERSCSLCLVVTGYLR
jgi:hypothetical protein